MVLEKPMLCVQGGPGLPEQVREVPAGSSTSDSRAQLGSLLQGTAPGQTLELEVRHNSCSDGSVALPGLINQPLRLNLLVVSLEPQANPVLNDSVREWMAGQEDSGLVPSLVPLRCQSTCRTGGQACPGFVCLRSLELPGNKVTLAYRHTPFGGG